MPTRDAEGNLRLIGGFAEDRAEASQVSRKAQDADALRWPKRAPAAIASGAFDREVSAYTGTSREGETLMARDERPGTARPERITTRKPASRKGGTVTAADASSISDVAAALVLAPCALEESGDLPGRARILGHASHAQAPELFTAAPVPASGKLLERLGRTVTDLDLREVNETFAVVPMAFSHEMGLDPGVVDVNGGACAMGRPIGAPGARIVVTPSNALDARGLERGVAAIRIGGGEGKAIATDWG